MPPAQRDDSPIRSGYEAGDVIGAGRADVGRGDGAVGLDVDRGWQTIETQCLGDATGVVECRWESLAAVALEEADGVGPPIIGVDPDDAHPVGVEQRTGRDGGNLSL